MLLKPLGYHLFRYTSEDLKVDWKDAPMGTESAEEQQEAGEHGHTASFAEKLQDVLVKGLEIADKVIVSDTDGQLSVRLHNTAYIGTCESLRDEVPQVCEQIGCPLCSMIACAYTEYTGSAIVIEDARCEERDIIVSCKRA